MGVANDIYEHLPPPGRSLAASARGLQLRLTRYDGQLEERVAAAHERERWSLERWKIEIDHLLAERIDDARRARYYRERGLSSSYGLDGVPITPKGDLRADPGAFIVHRPGEKRVTDRTSGTSGTPLVVTYDREAIRTWFALLEARLKRWHGVDSSSRWAMFGGQVVVPVTQSEPPFWVHNRPMRQLYVSTHHLSRQNTPAIAEALRRFGPRYLLGYPSSMAMFARFCLESDIDLPQVRVVLSNAETLTSTHREILETAFRAPVRNSYGMAEAVAGASECENGTMHLWPEVGILEVSNEAGIISSTPGDEGRLLATGLLNKAMPLLRYELGDRGSVPSQTNCPCGRTLPELGEIQGRTSDFLVTPDGRHVFWMNPIFAGLPIAEAQIRQDRADHVEVRVVPAGPWEGAFSAELVRRCQGRLGDAVAVDVSVIDEIERDANGKFRPVVSTVNTQ